VMQLKFLIASVAAVLLVLGGLLLASQKNYVFRFSEPELQQKLGDRLPLTKNYLFIFDVTLDEPRVDLVDGSDRIGAGIDVILNIKVGESQTPLGGSVDVIGGVKYVPEQGEFFITDPEIVSLNIQGLPSAYAERAGDVVSRALAEYYRTRPIYSLEGTDASHVATKLLLKDVAVEDQELVVTLGLRGKTGDD